MDIQFKSIKVQASLSDETPCYTAKLYIDGKHVADVSNRGHGGCDDYHFQEGFSYDDIKAADEWLKENVKPIHFHGMDLPETLETLGHGAAFRAIDKRNLQSTLSRNTLFIHDGKTLQIKGKPCDKLRAHIAQKYEGAIILNDKPIEEALDLTAAA